MTCFVHVLEIQHTERERAVVAAHHAHELGVLCLDVCVCICVCVCMCVRGCVWVGGWVGGWVWAWVWEHTSSCVFCDDLTPFAFSSLSSSRGCT